MAWVGALVLSGCGGGSPPAEEETCGNQEYDSGEECDDGNTEAGDGCFECKTERGFACESSTRCVPVCGDGLVVGDEACDGEPYCIQGCTRLVEGSCGDGIVQEEAGETCDAPSERYSEDLGAGGAGGASGGSGTSSGCDAECHTKFGYRCDANSCGQIDAPKAAAVNDHTRELCEWITDILGGPGSKNYCFVSYQEYVFTTNDVETCIAGTSSLGACTVGDVETWAASIDTCTLLTQSPDCSYE